MAIDKEKKSNRLLASRRYTHDAFTDAQESFTNVLDLQASEVYTQAHKIPSGSLPFSGSSQNGSFYTVNGDNILRYYYRHKLTKSNLNNEVWFFLNPTGSASGIGAQLIDSNQQTSFISPKYSDSTLANATAEDDTPGYLAKVFISTAANSASVSDSDVISVNNYQFDYKTGVLQFTDGTVDPSNSQYVYMSVNQYVGKTLADGIELTGDISGSASSTGSFGHLVVAGNITASGVVRADAFESVTGGDTIDFKDSVSVTGNVNADNLTADSSSFSTRVTNLKTDSGSFSTRITNFTTGNVELVSGSATSTGSFGYLTVAGLSNPNLIEFSSSISSMRTTDSSSISSRLTTEEANVDALQVDSASFSDRLTNPSVVTLTASSDVRVDGDLVVDGKVTAQEFHTEIVSSSIVFTSGSTKFGDSSDDIHEITGSLALRGNEIFFGTSSSDRTNVTLKGNQARIQYRHYTNNALYTYLNLASGGSILNTNFANNVNELFKIQANETTQWKFTTDIISGSNETTASFHHIHGASKLGVGTLSPLATVHISASDGLIIPVGNNAQRSGDAVVGEIRFNTDVQTYEGYDGNNWGSLGGMTDVDKDTLITAENSAGADNDELKFFTAGAERLRIFADGHISASGDITASKNLQVDGDVTTSITSTGSFGMIKKDGLDIREHFSRNLAEAFELDSNGDFQPSPMNKYIVDTKWDLDENGDLQLRNRELWTLFPDDYFSD